MLKLSELVENSIQLFSLPDIYFELRLVLDNKNSSLMDIVAVIKNDPAMTMRLLRLANSPFFGFASKIETLDRAINLLGAKQVHDLALSAYVISASNNIKIDRAILEKFWFDSLRSAVIARALAVHCNVIDSERLFVAGLLHNVGHLVMYSQIPEEAAYVGDDVIDLPVMLRAGLAITVQDAHPLAKQHAHWQTPQCGGRGAARDVCELIMQAQGTLETQFQKYLGNIS